MYIYIYTCCFRFFLLLYSREPLEPLEPREPLEFDLELHLDSLEASLFRDLDLDFDFEYRFDTDIFLLEV